MNFLLPGFMPETIRSTGIWSPDWPINQMSESGQIRPFASIEPHAGFTLPSRHCDDNQVVALEPNTFGVRSLNRFIFGKNSRLGGSRSLTTVPETFGMVDGFGILRLASATISELPVKRPLRLGATDLPKVPLLP
jgi:hypothetical protein